MNTILALMWTLAAAHVGQPERLVPIAAVIAAVTDDPEERALLVTVSLHETGLGRSGVPFGTTCRRGPRSLLERAQLALAIWRRSRTACWRHERVVRLAWYHRGVCMAPSEDGFAVREERTIVRLLAQYPDAAAGRDLTPESRPMAVLRRALRGVF